MSDDEKKGMERMLNRLMVDGDQEEAKELMAEAVTDYFRNDGDYYMEKNAEGIRVALQDKIACQHDDDCKEVLEPPTPEPVPEHRVYTAYDTKKTWAEAADFCKQNH